MQASISQLQGQVREMAELVSRSCDASCLAGTQSLQHQAGLHTANAEQAQQVCSILTIRATTNMLAMLLAMLHTQAHSTSDHTYACYHDTNEPNQTFSLLIA